MFDSSGRTTFVFSLGSDFLASAISSFLVICLNEEKKRVLLVDLSSKLILSKLLSKKDSRKDWLSIIGKQGSVTDFISSTDFSYLDILASDEIEYSYCEKRLPELFKKLVGGVSGEKLFREKLEGESLKKFYKHILIVSPSDERHVFVEGIVSSDEILIVAEINYELLLAKASSIIGIINLIKSRYVPDFGILKIIPAFKESERIGEFAENQLSELRKIFGGKVSDFVFRYVESEEWLKSKLFDKSGKAVKSLDSSIKKLAREVFQD